MNKSEIIKRLEKIAKHAVHTVGEEPLIMSLDDGIALHEAIELLEQVETNCLEIPDSWIPVSERMPKEEDAGILKKLGINKKSDYVIATVEVKGERMTVTACTCDGAWDWNMKYAFPDYKIIAWMELPKPWEGE